MFEHSLAIFFAARDIPLGTGVVTTGSDEFLSIGREPHRIDRAIVANQLAVEDPSRIAALHVFFELPQPHMPAAVAAREQIAAGRETQCRYLGRVPGKRAA